MKICQSGKIYVMKFDNCFTNTSSKDVTQQNSSQFRKKFDGKASKIVQVCSHMGFSAEIT